MREIEIKHRDEVVAIVYSISDAFDEITRQMRMGIPTHAHLGTVYQSSTQTPNTKRDISQAEVE